jgi:hypothetical protein
MPFPCRVKSHMPCRDSAASFVNVRVVAGNIRTASLLLVTTFVELRVVAGRSRTRAGRPHTVSWRPMLIHNTMPRCAVALGGRFPNGMVVAWLGRGMACVNETRPHCINQMEKTQSQLLAERHGMCELAFIGRTLPFTLVLILSVATVVIVRCNRVGQILGNALSAAWRPAVVKPNSRQPSSGLATHRHETNSRMSRERGSNITFNYVLLNINHVINVPV